ncbi:SH3 and PX domain-containing protein 2B [Lethenteron reissneri]|uniref:SH3 and PX domain-containing protein 2B n=1 Tax=Lethenteron reissneri TaxID=7753 RepID=UPI002AB66B5B|nr:SH3 and PX domain-containing protein 2B [Lethenteron reissneri]
MAHRAISDVRVQDFQKRRAPSKHYVYIIYVSWSDNSSHTIYRRYSKFFDLQMQLLDKFPVQGGQKDPKQRTIPFLPGKILFRRSHIRDVAVRRLKPIDEYCRALVQLPAEISQCEDVLHFFEARAEDLNPPKEDAGSKRKLGSEGIAEALVLEQYVVVAEYKKQQNSELNLVAGQVVEVIEKTETGWWFVSAQEEQGWVPATYLEPRDGSQDDLLIQNANPGEEERYTVMHTYAAQDGDELELDKGALVDVLQKNLEGWWFIRYQGKEGWAPASYLRKVREEGPGVGGRKPPLVAKRSSEEGAPPWGAGAPVGAENGAAAPTVARITPQRSSTESPKLRQRPPPRRDVTLPRGAQLPSLPEPPAVEAEYYTLAEFQSGIADGITFGGGQNVEVIEKNANGWWYVQIGDQEGWAPSSYIDKRKRPSAVARKLSNVSRPRIPPPAPPSPGAEAAQGASEYDTPAVDGAETSEAGEGGAGGGLVARAKMQLREVKRDDRKSRALSPTRPPPPIKTKQAPTTAASAPAPSAAAVEKPAFPSGKKPGPPLPDGRLGRKPKPEEWKKPGAAPVPAEVGDERAASGAPCNGSPKLPPRLPLKSKLEKCPASADTEKGSAGASEVGLPVKALVGDLMNAFAGLKPTSRNEANNTESEAKNESKAITGPNHPPIRPKPSVKPRPAMSSSAAVGAAKLEESQGNQIDIGNLRSHLRPTRQRGKPSADGADGEDESGPKTRTANGNSAAPPGKGAEPGHTVPLGAEVDATEETVSPARPKRPPPPKRPTASGNGENRADAAAKPADRSTGFVPRPPGAKPGLPVTTTKPGGSCPIPPTKPNPAKASGPKAVFSVPAAAAGKNALRAFGREGDGGGGGAEGGHGDACREGEVYVAVGDYAGDDDSLAVREGAALRVLEKDANGWWFCQLTGSRQAQGWVPSNYLRKQ